NTLRFGLLVTRATARELDLLGDRTFNARTSVALYAQDEWKLGQSLTLNPGLRLEWLGGFQSSARVEPRASLVWQSRNGLVAHVGYARYASAAPLGEEALGVNLPDERDDYVDAGLQQKFGAVTLGLDAYWRDAHNYIAEHEPLGSVVTTAFEFKRARIKGLEFSSTYARRGTTAWANVSLASAKARAIVGGEGLFPLASIAAASARDVPLASDRPITISGGLTHRVGNFSVGADLLVSSGAVRTLSFADPNGSRHSAYALIGLSAVYHARILHRTADLRLDLTNLTNVRYATSDAGDLEGGWTRWGRGRAITIGIEQGF
ncbi:MAG TPA: TonB-dependent receptor, partial [Sphingomicrobium sp.]|nr:TonB-dependent receptor [Sphingomicrobium sp.]